MTAFVGGTSLMSVAKRSSDWVEQPATRSSAETSDACLRAPAAGQASAGRADARRVAGPAPPVPSELCFAETVMNLMIWHHPVGWGAPLEGVERMSSHVAIDRRRERRQTCSFIVNES